MGETQQLKTSINKLDLSDLVIGKLLFENEALEPTGSLLPELIPSFCSMKRRSISTHPGRDASPSEVIPPQLVRFPQQFAGTQLYSWVEKGTVRVRGLA